MINSEKYYFEEAIREAEKAFKEGEVPVGCVIVKDGEIIAKGHNRVENLNDPTAHAEIIAIGSAGDKLKNWRLTGCTMYVTLEPCLMCTGALILSRIDKVVYLIEDPKFGAFESQLRVNELFKFNHRFEVQRFEDQELQDKAKKLIQAFFKSLRK
uniref:tRNA-specific adenosine deaminase n=1 Tax=candidate division WOR-3 bacterium TaxID=2052148 RepID=A0A7V3ZZ88_UNCW3